MDLYCSNHVKRPFMANIRHKFPKQESTNCNITTLPYSPTHKKQTYSFVLKDLQNINL